MVEENDMISENKKAKKWSAKCGNALSYIMCWRKNSGINKVLTESDKLMIQKAELEVLTTPMFKIHLSSS